MTDESRKETLPGLASIQGLLVGILLILTVMALFFAKDVFLPIILGFLLALTLSPVVRAASRFLIPPPVAAFVLICGLGACLFLGAYLMSDPVSEWIARAPSIGTQLKHKLSGISESVEAVKSASQEVEKIADASSSKQVQKVVVEQPGVLSSAVSNLASAATSLGIALVLAMFLMGSGDLFYEKLIGSFPKLTDKKKALRIAYDVERKISHYLFSITVINAILGLCVAGALYMIGLPYAYIWGVIAACMNFLPFVGTMVSTGLIAVYAIITFDTVSFALLAPGAMLFLSIVEGQVVTPLILGKRLELNAVAVFLTVVFWAWLWGIAGALMAVPFLVLTKVICDNVGALKTFGQFLSARTVETKNGD